MRVAVRTQKMLGFVSLDPEKAAKREQRELHTFVHFLLVDILNTVHKTAKQPAKQVVGRRKTNCGATRRKARSYAFKKKIVLEY